MTKLEQRVLRYLWSRAITLQSHGVVLGFVSGGEAESLLRTLQSSLDLIQDYDPHRLAIITQVMPRIFVCGSPAFAARFVGDLALCELRLEFVRAASSAELAATLVHESVHAQVAARALRRRGLTLLREERLALAAESQFAQRIPGAQALVDAIEARRVDIPAIYSPENQKRVRLLAARQSGVPEWLIRLLARIRGIPLHAGEWHDAHASSVQWERTQRLAQPLLLHWIGKLAVYGAWTLGLLALSLLMPAASMVLFGVAYVAGWALIAGMIHRKRRHWLEHRLAQYSGSSAFREAE